MTAEELLIKAIKEEIACQDAITRINTDRAYHELHATLRRFGAAGLLALALVEAEEQARDQSDQ